MEQRGRKHQLLVTCEDMKDAQGILLKPEKYVLVWHVICDKEQHIFMGQLHEKSMNNIFGKTLLTHSHCHEQLLE